MLADDVLEEKSELNIKGYFLAALARSHIERGVLSMIPSMLLTIVTRGKYKELNPSQQTQMIQQLDLTPSEIEKTLELSIRADSKAQKALQTVVKEDMNPDQLLTVCHRIGNCEAFSKQGESMCLLSALGKFCLCPYDDRYDFDHHKVEISSFHVNKVHFGPIFARKKFLVIKLFFR